MFFILVDIKRFRVWKTYDLSDVFSIFKSTTSTIQQENDNFSRKSRCVYVVVISFVRTKGVDRFERSSNPSTCCVVVIHQVSRCRLFLCFKTSFGCGRPYRIGTRVRHGIIQIHRFGVQVPAAKVNLSKEYRSDCKDQINEVLAFPNNKNYIVLSLLGEYRSKSKNLIQSGISFC